MTRKKIEIKKIHNTAARQVTFSKRRKGLFKKAHEISTLCDAEVALLVFSATGKLFEYSSTSTRQVIERRGLLPERIDKLDSTPSFYLQLESATRNILSKEVAEKTRELRQLRGEELEGLNLEELKHLEKLLKTGLTRVTETKDDLCLKKISSLKRKGAELKEENQKLKQVSVESFLETWLFLVFKVENLPRAVQEIVGHQGQPSEPVALVHTSRDPRPHGYNYSSDIFLTLGLPFPN
ncbi:MADS-box protein AGL24-like isoform X1 [Hibiscus syriacus]|uniref:MADS-box protein AGL24-like isoform X1 n=1 Tax=Hibiscus syriacus TaxID=106335 RepID=UPI00192064B2|nr:MADS-box protein AGL24-like isoform X1 [Hibiscus syriacus]XP_038991151.1 MADS-box protein AGL24-like isoform X1 [Hibiscus syriacus]